MSEKVYAIYSGCKFEGGGVECMYRDKEAAIKMGTMRFVEEDKASRKIHHDEPEAWAWKEIKEAIGGSIIKLWGNVVSEISVIEYDLK